MGVAGRRPWYVSTDPGGSGCLSTGALTGHARENGGADGIPSFRLAGPSQRTTWPAQWLAFRTQKRPVCVLASVMIC